MQSMETMKTPVDQSKVLINNENFTFGNSENMLDILINNVSVETIPTPSNISNVSRTESVFESQLMVPLYIMIFILSVVGNTLVLFTLAHNKRMRTVTNVYLLNLAVADLLLGVFCMPFTLVGQVLRNFVFGQAMCKIIPYFQAVSVSVAVWTLVAISLERYFAICRPLKSRPWQTRNHALKMIAFVWTASLAWCAPIVLVSTLQTSKRGHKCRESWPSKSSEQMFNLFLDIILLLIPMFVMSLAYFMIMEKLWKGLQREMEHSSCQKLVCQKSTSSPNLQNPPLKTKNVIIYSENDNSITHANDGSKSCFHCQMPNVNDVSKKKREMNDVSEKKRGKNGYICMFKQMMHISEVKRTITSKPCHHCHHDQAVVNVEDSLLMKETTYTFARHGIRSNYIDKSIEAKKKVIRMLFVMVAEFFICWAPLHMLNTWYLYYPREVYEMVGSTGVSLIQLLAYVSSCSNPITYCFMNKKFRQSFFTAFKCRRKPCFQHRSMSVLNADGRVKNVVLQKTGQNWENSCNDSSLFMGRISYSGRSEPEAEDRV